MLAVLPSVTPYQFAVYVLLVHEAEAAGSAEVKIGKRTLAAKLGKGTRSSRGNLQHIGEKLRELQGLGLIKVGRADREGTHIHVLMPREVPWVAERLSPASIESQRDYFADPTWRRALFDRDGWRCRYCGEQVTELTATLDHVIPRVTGGSDDPENLATACHECNSIKSGMTEAEAAPLLLARLRQRATGIT